MKFSSQTTSKLSAFVLAIFVTVGCAGINDANFSNDTDNTPVLEERDYTVDRPSFDDAPVLGTEQQEDILVDRPDND